MTLFLWIAVFAFNSLALDLPCGIPFGLRNSTLQSLQAIQEGSIDPGAFGTATLFWTKYGPKPWPRGSDNKITIPYCYKDANSRSRLLGTIEFAAAKWKEALGGVASKRAGHGIVFKEAVENGVPLYCFSPRASNGHNWNDKIPFETVYLDWSDQRSGVGATVGLIEDEEDPEPWPMGLLAGPGAAPIDYVHELGHILGMAHEHQRADRDRYVRFRCENLQGYDEAYKKAIYPDKSKLCTDVYTAIKYGFKGKNYVAGSSPGALNRAWLVKTTLLQYDYESIMHYPTLIDSVPEYFTQPQRGEEEIKKFIRPSKDDIAWLKLIYPWKD